MTSASTSSYAFGDMLALARHRWVTEIARDLAGMGYRDYRRSDAAIVRMLQRGPAPIGRIGDALGISRQAARKAVAVLERRGFVRAQRDGDDARQVNARLTHRGERYAIAVVSVLDRLNDELASRVDARDLASALTVLRAVVTGDRGRRVLRPDETRRTLR